MKLLIATILTGISLSHAAETPKTYDVTGIVKKLKPEIRTAVIDHEEIPGYMDAMVMSLEVRDPSELKGINPGDKIRFRMNVTEDDGWIDRLHVLQPATSPPPAEKESPILKPISPGEEFPNARLIDQTGKTIELSSYRGSALALTFIYTRCPFPNFCPRVNRHFRETQDLLAADPSSPKNWNLLSVTIEPDRDTPELLSSFAKAQGADPSRWKFATGSLREITRLTVQSGLNFWDDRGVIQHNLRTIVVDPQGRVTRVFGDDDLSPSALAAELKSAAVAKPCPCSEKKP